MRIIAGAYKGRSLKTTTGPGFRPAMGKVREALFSMLEARGIVWSETRVLDLFAGSGSLGFEALSRGAAHVCFVEAASYATGVIGKNAEMLEVEPERITIRQEPVGKALARRPVLGYSLVFIDPPYQLQVLASALQGLVKYQWLLPDAVVNAEVEAHTPFAPEKAHPSLTFLASRAYGQTRVILWGMNQV